MKKVILAVLPVFLAVTSVFSQPADKADYTKAPAIGLHFHLQDFPTAAYIRNNSLNDLIKDGKIAQFKDMAPGISLNYWKGLNNHIDFAATLAGSFLKYPFKGRRPLTPSDNKLLLELDATANFKLLPDRYFVTPYLTAGAGVSQYDGYWGAYIPVGPGVQFNFSRNVFLQLQGQYRMGISENTNYHFYYGLGLLKRMGNLKTTKAAVDVPPTVVTTDRDGDSVPDSIDACPDVPGPKELFECPDSDGDGVPDKDDKCPDVKGYPQYAGCLPPDRDGDGIPDDVDKCPDVPGSPYFNGCPIPDTDGDGVNDAEDHCLTEPGPVSNHGCPLIETRLGSYAREIYFASSSSKILEQSYAPMNELVKILRENPDTRVEISGHTDNTGSSALNMQLSKSRAEAVRRYLIQQGIAATRLTSAGYGPTQPIADNNTPEGKAMNRRVEIRIIR